MVASQLVPDFELAARAVFAVSGWASSTNAHEPNLRRGGLARETVQSAVRIAEVINAAATVFADERAAQPT